MRKEAWVDEVLVTPDGVSWTPVDVYCEAAWRTFKAYNPLPPKWVLERDDLIHSFADQDILLGLLVELGVCTKQVKIFERHLDAPQHGDLQDDEGNADRL